MKIVAMLRAEWARLTATPMAKLALLALMIVPLLYGGLYLWANQDPYDNLDEIPVALVVDDEGTEADGDYTNYGDEVADSLEDDGTFAWSRVSSSSAQHGVESGDFDFSVTIPKDFSESLVSSEGEDPHQADVVLTTNDANSYLSSTIGENAIKQIKSSIVQMVNKQAAGRLLDGIAEIRVNMVKAVDGTEQLADGADEAHDGAGDLSDGLDSLNDGLGDLKTGLNTLSDGTTTLAGGLDTLERKTQGLPGQTEKLAQGAHQVAQGDQKLADIADEVGAASTRLHGALPGVRDDVRSVLKDQGLDDDQIETVLDKLDPIGQKADDVNGAVQKAQGQIDTLASGAWQVSDGARTLADAMPGLTSAISSAADGAHKVDSGASDAASGASDAEAASGKAADGASTLHSGLGDLVDGIDELHGKLQDGVDQLPDSSAELRDKQASTIADPVDVSTAAVTSAGTYGAGLAPFFVALAAWIGIYALFLIVKPVSKRAITAMRTPIRTTLAGWLMPAGLGAIQMVALYFIVSGALGFTVHQPWGAFGIMALSSITFAAIILALNVWFGSVGQFLGLVLMVVQLVTAGGTFPWQTLPEPLRSLHYAFPMSYTVDALRQFMYGGSMSAAANDSLVLVSWLVGALLLTVLGVWRMTRMRTMRDLEPSLIG